MPTLKLDGDARGAVKAQDDLTNAAKRTEEQYKATALAAKKLEDAAKRIVKENETPQERYNRKNKELLDLFNKGAISADTMTRAMSRYRAELYGTGQAQEKAFGAGAAGNLVSYFSALVGPGALVSGAITALRNYNSEIDNLSSKMQGGRAGLGQLLQLAITSDDPAATRDKLFAEARKIYGMGATGSLGEAGNLVFNMESAGITSPKHRKQIAGLLASGAIPEANNFSAAIAALRSAYPDLSPDKLLGMGIVAAVPSPGGAEGIVQSSARSAEQLRSLGWSAGFGLSATSILSRAYRSPEEGATRLSSLARNLERFGYKNDPKLRGMDPFDAIERIGAGGLGVENLRKYMGFRVEAMEGFRTLYRNRDELRSLTGFTSGAGGDLVQQLQSLATGTPELENFRQGVGARNRRELSRMGPASTVELFNAWRDQAAAGHGALFSGVSDFFASMTRFQGEGAMLDTMRSGLKNAGARAELEKTEEGRDLLRQIEQHLRSMDRKTPTRAVGGRAE